MTAAAWTQHLERYLALRRACGFSMRPDERLLRDFLAYRDQQAGRVADAAQIAVAWAAVAPGRHPHSGLPARRLAVVRRFLRAVRADDPQLSVPPAGLLRGYRRPTPFLYTAEQIAQLMAAARQLGPRDTLRGETIATLIGLLVSCGLRAHEALRLTVADVCVEATPPHLVIVATKFRKSRVVPLHPTTAQALRAYAAARQRLGYDGLCNAFFVSERGGPWHYHTFARTVVALARAVGVRGPRGTRGPTVHQLRHTFAVTRLATWTQAGVAVRDHLATLAVYLGHVCPAATYWYLTATPNVLEPAARRFETYSTEGPER